MERTQVDPSLSAPRPAPGLRQVPRAIGDYRILRQLGEGGMGAVYLGYREGQDQQVAIKVLSDQARFYREARNAAHLNHPNIVRGLNVGQDLVSRKHFLVLEFVDGPSASAILEKAGRLAVGDGVHIALDIARALEHAHSRNIVHRDIKPDNILITRSGVAKLADLGLAKRTDEVSNLTATRQCFGTPQYMPYEQALNSKLADARSDIFALGASLYHLLTGQVPYPGDSPVDVIERKKGGEFVPAGRLNPEVPPALDRILALMLARDPRDRYQTASELIVDLDRSQLTNPVLSFADPDLARKDPWVRACMASAAQPTLLDVQSLARKKAVNGKKSWDWVLLVPDPDRGQRKLRATRRQIVRLLRKGRLSPYLQACRRGGGDFQPLLAYPEFRRAVDHASGNGDSSSSLTKTRLDESAAALEAMKAASATWLPRGLFWSVGVGMVVLIGLLALLNWLTVGPG
jgi:serine/threonine-protein kinase